MEDQSKSLKSKDALFSVALFAGAIVVTLSALLLSRVTSVAPSKSKAVALMCTNTFTPGRQSMPFYLYSLYYETSQPGTGALPNVVKKINYTGQHAVQPVNVTGNGIKNPGYALTGKIVYVKGDKVYVANSDGSGEIQRTFGTNRTDLVPVVINNGGLNGGNIVHSAVGVGANGSTGNNLYVTDANGVTRLLSTTGRLFAPHTFSVSPDGMWVTWMGYQDVTPASSSPCPTDTSGGRFFYIAKADGSLVNRVKDTVRSVGTNYCVRGMGIIDPQYPTHVLISIKRDSTDTAESDIFVMDINGAIIKQVTSNPGREQVVDVSAKSSEVLYISYPVASAPHTATVYKANYEKSQFSAITSFSRSSEGSEFEYSDMKNFHFGPLDMTIQKVSTSPNTGVAFLDQSGNVSYSTGSTAYNSLVTPVHFWSKVGSSLQDNLSEFSVPIRGYYQAVATTTYPNGGEIINVGTSKVVKWNLREQGVSGTTFPTKLTLVNSATGQVYTIATSVPSTIGANQYNWSVPASIPAATTYRVQATVMGNMSIATDLSDANFTIRSGPIATSTPVPTIKPNPTLTPVPTIQPTSNPTVCGACGYSSTINVCAKVGVCPGGSCFPQRVTCGNNTNCYKASCLIDKDI